MPVSSWVWKPMTSLPAVTWAVLGLRRLSHEPLLQRKSLSVMKLLLEGMKPLLCSRTYSNGAVLTPLSIRWGKRKWAEVREGRRATAPKVRLGRCMARVGPVGLVWWMRRLVSDILVLNLGWVSRLYTFFHLIALPWTTRSSTPQRATNETRYVVDSKTDPGNRRNEEADLPGHNKWRGTAGPRWPCLLACDTAT